MTFVAKYIYVVIFFAHNYLYIKEHGHTINSSVEQQHHQNIQMNHHNLMLNKMLASIGVAVPINIPDVPDIPYLTKISTTLSSNETHPPIYDRSS